MGLLFVLGEYCRSFGFFSISAFSFAGGGAKLIFVRIPRKGGSLRRASRMRDMPSKERYHMKKVLVIGSTGAMGQYLVPILSDALPTGDAGSREQRRARHAGQEGRASYPSERQSPRHSRGRAMPPGCSRGSCSAPRRCGSSTMSARWSTEPEKEGFYRKPFFFHIKFYIAGIRNHYFLLRERHDIMKQHSRGIPTRTEVQYRILKEYSRTRSLQIIFWRLRYGTFYSPSRYLPRERVS